MRSSFLELSNLDVDDKRTIVSSVNSIKDNITVSMPVNSGINFKGVLPFNGSKYVEFSSVGLCSVDCDRGWIRDSYKQAIIILLFFMEKIFLYSASTRLLISYPKKSVFLFTGMNLLENRLIRNLLNIKCLC
ncbi:unnamed protein product [Meloidogyne enterolobii]|uniref:Uncharacterized protein n=1 Tax=Meloidogyne enterolobii TaxID=390850 RepID=A0ACB1B6U1_MELEN